MGKAGMPRIRRRRYASYYKQEVIAVATLFTPWGDHEEQTVLLTPSLCARASMRAQRTA